MATVTVTGRTDTKERRRSKKDMEKRQNEEMEIDLLELFGVLIRKWKFLLLGLIIGGVLAGGYTWLQTPVYQSTAKLYVLSSTTSITSVADLQLGTELSTDFVEIAQSRPVIDTAIETLEADEGITLTRDEVHTMTSLSGFEALLHGKQVHCYGLPFYASWGLTVDEHHCPRRERRLTIADLIYQALIVYPTYIHPTRLQPITVEEAAEYLIQTPRKPLFITRKKAGRVIRYYRKLIMFCKVRFG